MRWLLQIVMMAALSTAPACFMTLESDGYLWACDDQVPTASGGVGTYCVRTDVRWSVQ